MESNDRVGGRHRAPVSRRDGGAALRTRGPLARGVIFTPLRVQCPVEQLRYPMRACPGGWVAGGRSGDSIAAMQDEADVLATAA